MRIVTVIAALAALSLILLTTQATATPSSSDDGFPLTSPQGNGLIQGDVDCNISVDAIDALGTLQHVAAINSPACIHAGDVNCSDSIDALDALAILRHVSAVPVDQNEPCIDIGQPLEEGESPGLAGPASEDLIEQALEDGDIDEETALLYRVYADFGDGRLPDEFSGDDRDVLHSDALRDARSEFDALSQQTQAALEPFLVPPNAPDSWENTVGARATTSGLPPWNKIDAAGGEVVVWWRRSQDESKAQEIAGAMDEIWNELTALMGREPLSDISESNNGGDGRFDVYMAKMKSKGGFVPYQDCTQGVTSGYLLINRDQAPNSIGALVPLRSVVAHEFMHAIQFGIPVEGGCIVYGWLDEATATWAVNYVFPEDKSIHPYGKDFLTRPDTPLNSVSPKFHPYGAYIFPFFLANEYSPSTIRDIYDNAKSSEPLEAVDQAIPGAFEESFPEFVKHNWNPTWEPLNKYREWDGFTGRAEAEEGFAPREVSLDTSSPDDRIEMPVQLEDLTSQYYHFEFTDDSVSTVVFHNGWTFELSESDQGGITVLQEKPLDDVENEGLTVQALIKLGGRDDWIVQDMTEQPGLVLCRDKGDERLEELVIIYANSNHESPGEGGLLPVDLDPTLWVSNMGCRLWEGTASSVVQADGVTQTTDAEVTFRSLDEPIPVRQSGVPPIPFFLIGMNEFYTPISGSIDWSISGTDSQGCTHSGSGTLPIETGEFSQSSLNTWNGVMAGEFHRGYSGAVFATEPAFYTISCPDQPAQQGILAPFTVIGSTPTSQVSSDGKTLNGSELVGEAQHEWSLSAQKE